MLEIPVPYWTSLGPLVSRRCNTYKLVDGIQDNFCYMNTNLSQDSVDQLAFRHWEIKIMVTGKDVVDQKRHPDLGQSGHASAHDPHLPPYHAPCKILSWGAQ